MQVTRILLGQPWLYDRGAYHSTKENGYYFLWKKDNILQPMNAPNIKGLKAKKIAKLVTSDQAETKAILSKKQRIKRVFFCYFK